MNADELDVDVGDDEWDQMFDNNNNNNQANIDVDFDSKATSNQTAQYQTAQSLSYSAQSTPRTQGQVLTPGIGSRNKAFRVYSQYMRFKNLRNTSVLPHAAASQGLPHGQNASDSIAAAEKARVKAESASLDLAVVKEADDADDEELPERPHIVNVYARK